MFRVCMAVRRARSIGMLGLCLLLTACGGNGSNGGVSLMGGAVQDAPLSLAGVVTTYAGTGGSAGSTDGTGTAAKFSYPYSITTDGTHLYIADYTYSTIRKIEIATRVVTTLAGSGSAGSADDTGTAASFNGPRGITTDGTNLYVADTANHTIRQIVIATGVVTTLAGSAGSPGNADDTGTLASFNQPQGITTDGTNLYVADTANNTIRQVVITTSGVTTLAGSGSAGFADGTGTAAKFYHPQGVTSDGTNLYVADSYNNRIRVVVIATGVVTSLAGSSYGTADGTGSAAQFQYPNSITADGTNLYVADTFGHTIRKIE